MLNFHDTVLRKLGENAVNQHQIMNILVWMNFHTTWELNGKEQYFRMTGNPADIFNRPYLQGSVSKHNDYCIVPPVPTYDRRTGDLTLVWSYKEYSTNGCDKVVAATDIGYQGSFSFDVFSLVFDMNGISTAFAVNANILDERKLLRIAEPEIMLYNGIEYEMAPYYDPRYPRMRPIYCMRDPSHIYLNSTDGSFRNAGKCFIRFKNTGLYEIFIYGIPVISLYTSSKDACSVCNGWNYDGCSVMDYFAGMIYFPQSYYWNNSVWPPEQIVTDYGYKETFDMAYSYSSQELIGEFQHASWTLDHSFCHKTCKIVKTTFLGEDSLQPEPLKYLTPDFYQPPDGLIACTDTFNTPNFEALADKPPAVLQEAYYKCYSYKSDALINAQGVASGNAALAGPILLLALIPICFVYLKMIGQMPEPEKYSEEETDKALKEFIVLLLSARDKDYSRVPPNGIVAKIVNELSGKQIKTVDTETSGPSRRESAIAPTRRKSVFDPSTEQAKDSTQVARSKKEIALTVLSGQRSRRNPMNMQNDDSDDDDV